MTINRRHFLRNTAVIGAAGPSVVTSSSADTDSEIMALFRQWWTLYHQDVDVEAQEEVTGGLLDQIVALEERMMALPARTAQDFAAKLIANTGNGDSIVADELIAEAVALTT